MGRLCAAALMLLPLAACGSTAPTTGDRVRVRNTSTVAIDNLVLQFPTDRIVIGSVGPGATSSYREAPNGVYGYAAFEARISGETINQPVIDWLGAEPLDGDAFTYVINLVPASDRTVINIVATTRDQ